MNSTPVSSQMGSRGPGNSRKSPVWTEDLSCSIKLDTTCQIHDLLFWAALSGQTFPPKQARLWVQRSTIYDFRKIEGWTVGHHNAAHESDLSWLRQQIGSVQAENKERQKGESERLILGITHHAPLVRGTSNPDQAKNPWSPAFATDILSQGDWTNVKAWIFGHRHYITELKKSGVKVVSNQRGYVLPGAATGLYLKKMENRTGFNVRKVIRIWTLPNFLSCWWKSGGCV